MATNEAFRTTRSTSGTFFVIVIRYSRTRQTSCCFLRGGMFCSLLFEFLTLDHRCIKPGELDAATLLDGYFSDGRG